MPLYEYKCKNCDTFLEIFKHKFRAPKWLKCRRCGSRMKRIFSSFHTDIIDRPRWSRALGVNETQIPQARRLWPDEKFNPKGDILIRNRKHKLQILKRRGMIELD